MRFRPILPLFLLTSVLIATAAPGSQTALSQAAKTAAARTSIIYRNSAYGFCFVLPESWKGYTIVAGHWNGTVLSSGQAVQGPQLLIRNPKWTQQAPYQDIPIMIFKPAEWSQVENVELSVSAAPIGPQELGDNRKFVFALPPRWIGFYDTLGQDELNAWMSQNRLQAPCAKRASRPAKKIP